MIRKLNCGFLILTYECNNKCKWCYAAPAGFKAERMPFDKAKQFLKLMKSLGAKDVGLCGGEPTLYPDLVELIVFGKKQGLDVTLYTNGRALSKRSFVKEIKRAGTDFVNVSIQGVDPKNHDRVTGAKGSFEETAKGIKNCFEEKLAVNLETVVSHTKLMVYKELMDSFPEANVFIFYREIPLINCLNAGYLSNSATRKIFREIFSYAKGKRMEPYFFARMPYCWFEQDALDRGIQSRIVSHCHVIPGNNLIVDVDGKVLPCAVWVTLPSMNLLQDGKVISKKRFLADWNKGTPAAVRKELTKYPAKECIEYEHWGKKCTGGCPLTKFELAASRKDSKVL